ncbi:MAG: Bro-N domain-containing protein, partial [Oscillospiraceae bacterium]|nr:Bro-N domain-containing protein [Oscillospiraceae bacterium]
MTGEVRTQTVDGEPYFVGKDVAEILGYSRPDHAITAHVDDEDKNTVTIRDGKGNPNQTVINESGLYPFWYNLHVDEEKKDAPIHGDLGGIFYYIQNRPDSYTIEDPAARARRWAEEYEEKKALEAKIEEQKSLVEYAEH